MKRYKKTDTISYALGITVTFELLLHKPEQVECVYINSKLDQNETYFKLKNLCNHLHIPTIQDDKVFHVLSEKENCFVIGVFQKYENQIDLNSSQIVLVNPSNMGNLGTIIRAAIGFEIQDLVIITPAVDVFHPKTIRSSMGALFHIRISYYETIETYLEDTSHIEKYCFMLDGSTSLSNIEKKVPYALIFGNEATGLSSDYTKIGNTVLIKHSTQIDSLNLDNAVSIALYEFTKDDFML